VSVVDLQPFFGPATPAGEDAETLVALVGDSGRALGLRIDEVIGPRVVFRDECDADAAPAQDFALAATRDLLVLLDLRALLARPELVLTAAW
jgi:hypothetical protein